MTVFTFEDWLTDKLEIEFKRDWEFDSITDDNPRRQRVKEENENREKGSARVRFERGEITAGTYDKITQHQEQFGIMYIEFGQQQKIESWRESIRNADVKDLPGIIAEEIAVRTEDINRDLTTRDGLSFPARAINLSIKKKEKLPLEHVKGSEYLRLKDEIEKMENGQEFSLKGLCAHPLLELLNRTIEFDFIEFLKIWNYSLDPDKETMKRGGLVSLMEKYYPVTWGTNGPFENETDYAYFIKTLEDYLFKEVKLSQTGPSALKTRSETKTRLASILKTVYLTYRDTTRALTKDKEFLKIVCLIDRFGELGHVKTADFISRKTAKQRHGF